ncbi:MAG: hypothetical protein BK997_01080 [Candidatus Micrarchaeum sp. ARMAN-1]|jgi:hypothetical protein|nr:MAG: hypothetical protein BK997_01080 [Candidatus Micrarchaeum sp. ARMAN-1]
MWKGLFGKKKKVNGSEAEGAISKIKESLDKLPEDRPFNLNRKLYEKHKGKVIEVAFCNSCGEYKSVENMEKRPITIISGGNILPKYNRTTSNVCSDCQAKENRKTKKKG